MAMSSVAVLSLPPDMHTMTLSPSSIIEKSAIARDMALASFCRSRGFEPTGSAGRRDMIRPGQEAA